jgi:hypothetical protein
MYAAWKVAGERIIDSQGRTQLCKEAGQVAACVGMYSLSCYC